MTSAELWRHAVAEAAHMRWPPRGSRRQKALQRAMRRHINAAFEDSKERSQDWRRLFPEFIAKMAEA
jgi:hypothetical protein